MYARRQADRNDNGDRTKRDLEEDKKQVLTHDGSHSTAQGATSVLEAKETEAKETEAKETEAKETEAKETEAKETEAKETEAKETEAKETEAKETEAKETEAAKDSSSASSKMAGIPLPSWFMDSCVRTSHEIQHARSNLVCQDYTKEVHNMDPIIMQPATSGSAIEVESVVYQAMYLALSPRSAK
jgi:hypothetical protein